MEEKKSLRDKYNGLSRTHKIQVIIASLLTCFLIIAVPVYAWFTRSSDVETLTKVKAPATLDIKAGHAYSISYLTLSDIDVTVDATNGQGHKDYIFAVKAGNSSAYDIQLAHTTNIPFTYSLYRASELGNSEELNAVPDGNVAVFDYRDESLSKTITYYYGYASASESTETGVNTASDAELNLEDLNPDTENKEYYGRKIAEKQAGADKVYSKYSKYSDPDSPEIYAVPLYSQHKNITTWNPLHDYFILRISWNTNGDGTAFSEWNAAANNKETDMIYISAKSSASH